LSPHSPAAARSPHRCGHAAGPDDRRRSIATCLAGRQQHRAGQPELRADPDYLAKQLANFKPAAAGKPAERNNAIMAGFAATLSPEDMRNVAAHYAAQRLQPEKARNKDTIELGQKIYRAGIAEKGIAACAGCHGPRGEGVPAQYPALAGQFADYLDAQLRAFQSGARANDPNKVMRMTAANLSDAEIKAVTDYIAGLRSGALARRRGRASLRPQ
jgi:cytochrome c553